MKRVTIYGNPVRAIDRIAKGWKVERRQAVHGFGRDLVVVHGEPGCGKTTLIRRIQYEMRCECHHFVDATLAGIKQATRPGALILLEAIVDPIAEGLHQVRH